MNEDTVLHRAIEHFQANGWRLVYRTRQITQGAIGGVDAILLQSGDPWQFVFIDAKGDVADNVRRSTAFTNALGSLVKRIRFEKGYGTVEAANRFLAGHHLTGKQARHAIQMYGVHKRSEYILAVTSDYKQTVRSALDPTLAAILNLSVFIVTDDHVKRLSWE